MEDRSGVCQHPNRLQIGWYVQLCMECGEKISVDIPSYPKDEEAGRRLLRGRFSHQKEILSGQHTKTTKTG